MRSAVTPLQDTSPRASRPGWIAVVPLVIALLAILLPIHQTFGGEPAAAVKASSEGSGISAAPDFTATGVDGKTYRLSELLKNGPVLLDFWTTYCGPCMLELPKLQKMWEQYKDRGFTLVGVVCDDQKNAAKIKPTILSKNFKFLNLVDSDHKIGSLYSVRQFPVSVLVAPDGKIATKVEGYKPGGEKEFEKRILPLLPNTAK